MADAPDQGSASGAQIRYEDFMVIEGSDGTVYQIPLADLRKYRVPDDEAKHYPRVQAPSISCRIKCREA